MVRPAPPRRARGIADPSPRAAALREKLRLVAHGTFEREPDPALAVSEPPTTREVLLAERLPLRALHGGLRELDVEVSEIVASGTDAWAGFVTGLFVSAIDPESAATAAITLDVDRMWRMCGVDDEVLLLHRLTAAGAPSHIRRVQAGLRRRGDARALVLALLAKVVATGADARDLGLLTETQRAPDTTSEAGVTLERLRTHAHGHSGGSAMLQRIQQVQTVTARRRDAAVRRIQTAYRRHRLQRELDYHRERFRRFREQRRAACVMQAAVRLALGRWRVQRALQRRRENAAAVVIQATVRMFLAKRERYRLIVRRAGHRVRVQRLVAIQCAARVFLARRRLADQRVFRRGLIRLQAETRRIVTARRVERERQRRLRAAGKLVAVKGTRQGHSGFYLLADKLSFFHRLPGGAWELVAELTEEQWRACRDRAIHEGRVVPAPGVAEGAPGLHVDAHGHGAVWVVTPSGAWRNRTQQLAAQAPPLGETIGDDVLPLQRRLVWKGRHRVGLRSMMVDVYEYGRSGFYVMARFGKEPPLCGRIPAGLLRPPFEGRQLDRLRRKLDRLDVVPHPIQPGAQMLRMRVQTAVRRRGKQGNAACKIQTAFRRMRARNAFWRLKATMALGTERHGVSVACPGTAQGFPGLYFGARGGMFAMDRSVFGTWEVIAGPLSRRMYNELWRRAIASGEAVPLPGTMRGGTGLYVSADGEVQYWVVTQPSHGGAPIWVLHKALILAHAQRLALLLQALYRARNTRRAWLRAIQAERDRRKADEAAERRKEVRIKRAEARLNRRRRLGLKS